MTSENLPTINVQTLKSSKVQTTGDRGTLLVVVSAAAFGLMPVLTKLAYEEGLNTRTLLTLRFGIAALGMWLIWAIRRHSKIRVSSGRPKSGWLALLVPLV